MRLRYLFVIVAAASLVSCFKDDTTLGTGAISEIKIDSICEVYNINQNDTLVINPTVTQTNQPKELTYTWEIELKSDSLSHGKSFVFVGKQFGSYRCRLIVENSDGKAFFPFVIHVNTIYEEGLTIISKDADGKAMLSFMLTPPDGSEPTGFMHGDQFFINNEESLADNPTDIVQSDGSLIIACRGSNDGSVPATIYRLNEKTFFLENMASEPSFTDFKPTILGIPEETSAGRSYPIICEGGNTYEYSPNEGVISKPLKLPYAYAQTAFVRSKGRGSYNFLCWDDSINALCQIYDGYAPAYYYGEEYQMKREMIIDNSKNNPLNGLELRKIVLIEQDDTIRTEPQALIITKDARFYYKTLLSVEFWEHVGGKNELTDDGGKKRCGAGNTELALTDTTPCVAKYKGKSMLFAEGNKVRSWEYISSTAIYDAKNLHTIGSESAVITSLALSTDQTKVYVAFYEPEQSGLNGSVWVVGADNNTIYNKYENVCYQPVKIIYKKKN